MTLAQPDGLSLAQQAALMQSATVLVQMHGASMANWLFLPQVGQLRMPSCITLPGAA